MAPKRYGRTDGLTDKQTTYVISLAPRGKN